MLKFNSTKISTFSCFFLFLTLLPLVGLQAQQKPSDYDPNLLQTLSFPGAEGFGRFTTGGRAGTVIKVTNLNDSGPGSLREAIDTKIPRIIIFEVSGTIFLNSPLRISSPDITIAGQTAPGDGITLANYPLSINTSNVIIRFMRFRLGDRITAAYMDSMESNFNRNIIIDHCSLSWGTDETGSFYANENFTFQWSILSEGLNYSNHDKSEHGYGGIWGGKNASFHHNLIAHFTNRNPRFDHPGVYKSDEDLRNFRGIVDFRNNVIYNWRDQATRGGEEGRFNLINNYYKSGPATRKNDFFLHALKDGTKYDYGRFYVDGNILEGNTEVNNDNWQGVNASDGTSSDLTRIKLSSALPSSVYEVTHSASIAYQRVLAIVGASFKRDPVDTRIIQETTNRRFTFNGSGGSTNGIIDSQTDVGGWPSLKSSTPPVDTDNDGMPDAWEVTNNLNPNRSNDREYNLHPYYTDVEVYINSLVQHLVDAKNPGVPLRPNQLRPTNTSTVVPVDVTLAWLPVSNASTYRLQISTTADFSSNVTTFDNITFASQIIPSLVANATYYWRVRASNASGNGSYSNTWSFKTSTTSQVPEAPLLMAPASGTTDISVFADLRWAQVPNATSYRLQISTTSDFSSIIIDERSLSSTTYRTRALSENTVYFWRVRGINSFGTGPASAVFRFRTVSFSTLPNASQLLSPTTNTTAHPVALNFEWLPEPTAQHYTLQISTSPDFSSYVVNEKEITSTSFVVDNLRSNTTYFWRVRSFNRTGGGPNSTVWQVRTTAYTQPPSRVDLISPAHNSNKFSTTLTFSWQRDPVATSYRLQVSTTSDFSTFVLNQSGITGNSFTLNNLKSNTVYFWRVIASNEAGSGTASKVWNVRSSTYSGIPPATTLLSPADNSTRPANNIHVSWANVSSASEYRLQVSETADFSTYTVNVGGIEGTSYQLPPLRENRTYYWRVRTRNPAGDGARSLTWKFTTSTNQAGPENTALISPTNNSTNLSKTVTLHWEEALLADSYRLEVSKSSNFSTFVVSISGLKDTRYILDQVEDNTTYYWRVRPFRNNTAGQFSPTWLFKSGAETLMQSVASDLLGHWTMNESSGTRMSDSSGNSNDATVSNSNGITWIAGRIGNASNLNGTTGTFGSVPHKSALNPRALTIAVWISPQSLGNRFIISKGAIDGFELRTIDTGVLEFRFNRETNGSTYRLRSIQNYPTDGTTWMHVAVTFDGSRTSLYINGVLDNSATYTSPSILYDSNPLQIGARNGSGRWLGRIDDLRLHNRALTASEIAALANVPAPIPATPLLISPANSATGIPTMTTLRWNASEHTTNYRIQISTSSSFSSFVVNQTTGTSSSFNTPQLVENTRYFWRVSASNSTGTSSWSSVWSFTTASSTASRIATLISPQDNSTNLATKVNFKWNKVEGATEYRLQISKTSTFNSYIYNQGRITTESYTVTGLEPNTRYYWRVRVPDSSSWGTRSEVWTFVTGNLSARTDETVNTNETEEEASEIGTATMLLFPNPAQHNINIILPKEHGHVMITISDMAGKEILNRAFESHSGSIAIDLPDNLMKSGVYMVQIRNNRLFKTFRLIKE